MKNLIQFLTLIVSFSAFGQASLEVNKLGQLPYIDGINEIWGYADSATNREFALVGVNSGFSIVEVTDPTLPVEKHFIPGTVTTWRDVKTFRNYAYVVHDGVGSVASSDGVLIVDLSTVDSTNISYTQFYPSVTIDTITYNYHDAHNIYIDENGIMYMFGSNLGSGSCTMFDLNADPNQPVHVGSYNGNYYHDGVARGDTLWGAAIYAGQFEVIDVNNKQSPSFLAAKSTPNNFCHNIWFSDDNKTVITTDEKQGAFFTSYDVSDLNNITELDRIQTSIDDPTVVIPHNTHILNNFMVNSYYTSGLQIVDISHPNILVETAHYDTSPISGGTFDGAWGAYPFLPSGNILVSDRDEGLFVLGSRYPKACFFSAFVKDSVTGTPIISADITMVGSSIVGKSDLYGNFEDGQKDSGVFLVVVQKPGYHTDTLHVNMREGVDLHRTVALIPIGFTLSEWANSGLEVYPNPFNEELHINLQSQVSAETNTEIFSLSGERLFSKTITGNDPNITLKPNLNPGVYVLKIKSGDVTLAARRIIVKP